MTTYNNSYKLLTDESIISELGERVRQGRLKANITQNKLAKESGVAKRTIERFENGASIQLTSFIRILRALDYVEALAHLVPEQTKGPMEILNKKEHTRHRATGNRGNKEARDQEAKQAWEWAE